MSRLKIKFNVDGVEQIPPEFSCDIPKGAKIEGMEINVDTGGRATETWGTIW